MPELPDIYAYVECLNRYLTSRMLQRIRIRSPFVVRSVSPPIRAIENMRICNVSTLGKRVVWEFENDLYLVVHLMIAGRFRWSGGSHSPPRRASRIELAWFQFETGTLTLTEASPKKRVSLYLVRGHDHLQAFDRGGIDVLATSQKAFEERLRLENHPLKRSLTDSRLFSGIGNAYSDEILFRARISPIKLTNDLSHDEVSQLFHATQEVLNDWKDRLSKRFHNRFPGPGEIAAFRPEFKVHGRFGQPCKVCQSAVQRIRYAANETNYCPRCQIGGKVLADRSLSRLLKSDWPRSVEDWEG